MPEEYSKEQLWKLYEALPKELKEAIFSEETANSIYEACTKNGVTEEKISEVAKYTGYVLFGLLPPNEFERILEFKLALTNEQAKNINRELARFVFFPLRSTLETIYKTQIEQVGKPKPSEIPEEKKPVTKRTGRDIYREPVE